MWAARPVVALFLTLQTAPSQAPGLLVDVSDVGHLHINCTGEGSPTVVIDGGAGSWSLHFAHIQSALEKDTRVCTYDRAGLGWSDVGPSPRTSRRMVAELHRLLHNAGVAPPLLLVGHSLGGYNVRIYQATYPQEVAGLVLLDSAHEGQWERLPKEVRQLVLASPPVLRKEAEMARQGHLRAADVDASEVEALAPASREQYVAAMLTAKPYEALAEETEAAFASASEVPAGPMRGDPPLVVLTARRSFDAFAGSGIPVEEANAVWMTLQTDLARLSSRSTHLFSDGDHRLHVSDPGAVIDAVRRGIEMVQGKREPPAGLGLPEHTLPMISTPAVDRLLEEMEEAYRAMETERFVNLFADDVVQLDVNRRVHVSGRQDWTAWTRRIHAAHLAMTRRHRGRAVVGEVIIAEIEWSGTVRGDALGTPGEDRTYQYTGLGPMRLADGKIREQILHGDFATLSEQLGLPPTQERERRP